MALQLRESLRVGKIAYSPHFFSLSMSRDEAKKRLGGELRKYARCESIACLLLLFV